MSPTICELSGKIRYATRQDAQLARAEWRKQARTRDISGRKVPDQLYQCGHCDGGWHLSKKLPRKP